MQLLKELPMVMRAPLLLLIPGLLCLASAAFSQETKSQSHPDSLYSSGTLTPPTPLPVITAREPGSPSDAILLSDGKGGYGIAVIGPTLEEFDEWMKRTSQPNPEPLYLIQSLFAEGKVTDNIANLKIQLLIQTNNNEPFLQIPIGLKSGILPVETDLSQLVQYDGPSLFQIIPNPQGNGYDMILRTKPVEWEVQPSQPQHELKVPESSPTEPATEPDTEGEKIIPVTPSVDRPTVLLTDNIIAGNGILVQGIPGDQPDRSEIWHTITLQMDFPVSQLSVDEYQLKVDFPSSLMSSVKLVVPQPDAVVMQPKGGILRQTTPFDEQSTLFVFQRTPSDFEVQWHKKQHSQVQQRAVLQVEDGRVVARVSSSGVKFDAVIPVKSSGGSFDSFTLQLPRGAVFLPSQTAETTEYQVEVLPPERDVPDDPSHAPSQGLLFRLSEPTEGPIQIRIAAETPFSHSRDGRFEVGGFEVIGAKKQFGKLSVIVPQETRLRWQKERGNIRPSVDPSINEIEGIVSTFEYYEQPCSLLVQAVPQSPRVRLRPEYQVQIYRNHAVLQAKLTYTIYGSLNRLNLNMNGWQLTDIEPNKNIDLSELPFMEDGPITIPLTEPVGKNIELNLLAEREFNSHDDLVRFPFPIPKADVIEPALLAVIPDDNIELTVDESHPLVEMSQQSLRGTPLQIELPVRQQGALVYRIDHPVKAEFCVKPVLHQQKITVQSLTELTLQTSDPVKQTLEYTVEYEHVTRLILAVPAELDNQRDLHVMFESRELKLNDVTGNDMIDRTGRDTSLNPVVLKLLRLPDARIGTFHLTLDFKLKNQIRDDLGQEQRYQTFPVRIPIVLPHDGQLIRETVHIRYPRGLQVNHMEDETGWKKKESSVASFPASHIESVYQTEQADSLLLLGAVLKNAELSGTTIVEKGLVRHWLQDSGRTDCACYRISTNQSHLTMILPEHVRTDNISIKVDGRNVAAERNGQNAREWRIPLPPSFQETASSVPLSSSLWLDLPENESPRTLEIRYEIPMITSVNRLTLDMPAFPPEVTVRPVYCQVILPNMRHLLSWNAEWMPLYQWRFGGGLLSRKSDLTQHELEDQVGIPHAEPISQALNSYLFIAFHPESRVQLNLADRSTLVLVSSGLILLFGLILIYFPRLRYPGVLFTFLVLFVSAFAYRVTLAILFLQAGLIGFVLVLVALFLYRMFVSGDPWRETIADSLPVPKWKDPTRIGHPVISSEEGFSDPARVAAMPTDQAEPDSRVAGEEHTLAKTDVAGRKNDDAVSDDVSGVISHPVSDGEVREP